MTQDWTQFLTNIAQRQDLDDFFPPDKYEDKEPAFLASGPALTAGLVAARVLEIIARRGGTRVDISAFSELRSMIQSSVPDEVSSLTDDEASRILDWLDRHPEPTDEPPGGEHKTEIQRHLDLLSEADIESRRSVVEFAMAQDYDLELEYYETDDQSWPIIRCSPEQLTDEQFDEDTLESVRVDTLAGSLSIPLERIRWLMPIAKRDVPVTTDESDDSGEVIPFPSSDSETDDRD